MIYDNGSITRQASIDEKNALAAEELAELKSNAKRKTELDGAREQERAATISALQQNLMDRQRQRDAAALDNGYPISTSQVASENRAGVDRSFEQALGNKLKSVGNAVKSAPRGLFDLFSKEKPMSGREAAIQKQADAALAEQEEYESYRALIEAKKRGEIK